MKAKPVAVWSACHFLMDFSCALLLFRAARPAENWALCALVYNFCAFALQCPLGLLADRLNKNTLLGAVGCLVTAAAFVPRLPPLCLGIAAGVGNALLHVGGGTDILNRSHGKSAALGIYVSPGAIGLFLGTVLGKGAAFPLWAAPLLLVCGAAALFLGLTAADNPPVSLASGGGLTAAALGLFLVVVLRSLMGFLFAFPWKSGAYSWLFVLAVAGGKAAGGLFSDRLGAASASRLSLAAAACLFLFSDRALCGLIAVALFNMTMPVTLRAAADIFPDAGGFSFGLLTLALFLGFLPCYFGLSLSYAPTLYAAGAVVSLLLLSAALQRIGKCSLRL